MILPLRILFVFTLCLLTNSFAKTDWDYRFQGSFRSYPQGGAIDSDLGVGKLLWKKNPILYGYVRSSLQLKTSAIVNYATAQLEVFPVSFIGLYIAKSYGHRSLTNLQGFDCLEVNCTSSVRKNLFGMNVALAYKKFKLVHFFRQEQIHYKDKANSFAEELSNLILTQNDKLDSFTTIFGRDLKDQWFVGALHLYSKAHHSASFSSMNFLVVQKTIERWSFQGGVGKFRTSLGKDHLSSLFIIRYNGKKGLRLF